MTNTKTVSRIGSCGVKFTGKLVAYGEYRAIVTPDGEVLVYHPVAGECAAWEEEDEATAEREAIEFMKDASS